MKKYSTHKLKIDTSSGDMNENVDHWLDSTEKFHKKYVIMPLESLNCSFLKRFCLSLFDHQQISLIMKIKQDVI